jgi:hypothetical protein
MFLTNLLTLIPGPPPGTGPTSSDADGFVFLLVPFILALILTPLLCGNRRKENLGAD